MKNHFDQDELLRDVLHGRGDGNDEFLNHGLAMLRRTRVRRRMLRVASVVAPVLLLAWIWVGQHGADPTPTISQAPNANPEALIRSVKTIPGTPIRVIGDEELLAMFAGRPVALLVNPGGNTSFCWTKSSSNSNEDLTR
jgi:hypothetical protein